MKRCLIFLLFAILFHALPGWTDEHPYLETRPYGTALPGEVELEYWFDSLRDYSQHQIEVELGITPNYQIAFYGVWRDDKENGFHYHQTKFENKIRLAQPGDFIIDPSLYVEFELSALPKVPSILETKLILSKDFDDWNLNTNFTFEKELAGGRQWEFEFALGVSRILTEQVQLGVEYLDQPADGRRYVIPGVYTKLGDFKLNVGLQVGLNQADSRAGVRTLMAWEF